MIPSCMRCQAKGVSARGSEIYPNRPEFAAKRFYRCPKCRDCYVGRHANGKTKGPLMVDAPTLAARMKAHKAFDQLWRLRIVPDRNAAYRLLAEAFKLKPRDAHIGHFDRAMSLQVMAWANRIVRAYRMSGLTDE